MDGQGDYKKRKEKLLEGFDKNECLTKRSPAGEISFAGFSFLPLYIL